MSEDKCKEFRNRQKTTTNDFDIRPFTDDTELEPVSDVENWIQEQNLGIER